MFGSPVKRTINLQKGKTYSTSPFSYCPMVALTTGPNTKYFCSISLFQEYGSSVPWSVQSRQASGLSMDATMNGPSHLLCIFPFCMLFRMHLNMRLPSLISRGLTFLFIRLCVSSWYLARLMAACILTISMVSIVGFKSSSVVCWAPSLVLQDLSRI